MLFRQEKALSPQLSLAVASRSEKGGRAQNEDSLLMRALEQYAYCFAVADGLGGHQAGKQASEIAVAAVAHRLANLEDQDIPALIAAGIHHAHHEIRRAAETDLTLKGMKSTLLVLLIIGRSAYWGNVGDSRLYIFRDGKILERTRDHSVVQLLVDSGEISEADSKIHPDRNRIYQALGSDSDIHPTVKESGLPLLQGDHLLLCTDGFWQFFDEQKAIKLFMSNNITAKKKLNELFSESLRNAKLYDSKHDNITAQLVVVR